MSNNSLALVGNGVNAIDPITMAQHFVKSGYFRDVTDISKAVVKAQLGAEFGLGPMTAMMNVYLVEGKPSMGAHLIGALVRKAGYDYRVTKNTNEECRIVFFDRANREMGDSVFTMEDARRAQLAGKGNWAKYPKAMLFARAMSQGAKMHCSDATMGVVYTPDELGAEVEMSETGDILSVKDVTPVAPAPEPAPQRTPAPSPTATLIRKPSVDVVTGEIVSTLEPLVKLGDEYTNPSWAQDAPDELDQAFSDPPAPAPRQVDGPYQAATEQQVKAIKAISKRLGLDPADVVMEIAQVELDQLSKADASLVIESLNKRAAK